MKELNHIGIPTSEKKAGEKYLADAKVFITDAEKSAHKIEWLRFEAGSPMPGLLKTTTHIAYAVDDIESEMKGKKVLAEPYTPAEGLTVAFIEEEGVAIELMQFRGHNT